MLLVYLFFIHFFSDFVLQPRWMATRKSSEIAVLLGHVNIIFMSFLVGLALTCSLTGLTGSSVFFFSLLNAGVHAAIDWNIWKGYKLLVWWKNPTATPETWRYWEDHWFYTFIGADQFLHGATILLLAEWLLK